jgi:hypothetical protein
MTVAVVVPSPRLTASEWEPAQVKGLELLKVHGLEEVRVLGDSVPVTQSWVSNPTRQNSGLVYKAITTAWKPVPEQEWLGVSGEVKRRNEALLTDADVVVILGEAITSSSLHFLARAFTTPKIHVAQVVDGVAKIVGRETVVAAKPIEEPSAPQGSMAGAMAKFMAPAPKTKK